MMMMLVQDLVVPLGMNYHPVSHSLVVEVLVQLLFLELVYLNHGDENENEIVQEEPRI